VISGAIVVASTPTFITGGSVAALARDPAIYSSKMAAGPSMISYQVIDSVDMRVTCLARQTKWPEGRLDDIELRPMRSVALDGLADDYREGEVSRGRLAAAALPVSVATAAGVAAKSLRRSALPRRSKE
jgi:hypothetical protein